MAVVSKYRFIKTIITGPNATNIVIGNKASARSQ